LSLHLFRAEPFSLPIEVRKVCHAVRPSGCTLQLLSDQAALYISATLISSNKGWQSRWFYLRNDDELLPVFTHHVVLGAEEKWRWGLPRDLQTHLKSLLEVLRKLWATVSLQPELLRPSTDGECCRWLTIDSASTRSPSRLPWKVLGWLQTPSPPTNFSCG
jgi:hypothetical protein